MRYGQIRDLDVANGPGIRVSLFVTGCYFNCYKCFNQEYQSFNYGDVFTKSEIDRINSLLDKPHIRGLSILGGEPMEHSVELANILDSIKLRDDQNIWLWSGYTFENILLDRDKVNLLKKIDVLVDGQFENDKKDLNLVFRGSSNQRIIDVNKSLLDKKVILLEGY